MRFIDTHSHAYDPIFDDDCEEMILRSCNAGVDTILLADVDSQSREAMVKMAKKFPTTCHAMCGVHPTSINEMGDEWHREIEMVKKELSKNAAQYIAVGEIGLDLYWSQEFEQQQREAFCAQLDIALKHSLPVAIHIRDAWAQSHQVLAEYRGRGLRGVIHAFSGTMDDYLKLKEYGDFAVGIGGVVTFKKATLADVVREIPLHDIVLETDAPYLTPTPHRGKRNESSHIPLIAQKIADIKGITLEEVADTTTANALRIFGVK